MSDVTAANEQAPDSTIVVSADTDQAAWVVAVLRHEGITVDLVQHDAVLERMAQGRCDAAILNASDTQAIARTFEAAPNVAVVVVTARETENAGAQAMRLGAQDYVLSDELTAPLLRRSLTSAITRHRTLMAVRELSLTDPLTGLYNRRGFNAIAEQQLGVARRGGRSSLLVCADMDGLKPINDRFGHLEGDRALCHVAGAFRSCFRTSDIVSRIGGDEFIAFAPDVPADAEQTLTGRVTEALRAKTAGLNLPYSLTLSVGTAAHHGHAETTLLDLINRADKHLYMTKHRPPPDAGRGAQPLSRSLRML